MQPILQRLKGKAQKSFDDNAKGLPPQVLNDVLRPSKMDDEKSELEIFSGKTHTVATRMKTPGVIRRVNSNGSFGFLVLIVFFADSLDFFREFGVVESEFGEPADYTWGWVEGTRTFTSSWTGIIVAADGSAITSECATATAATSANSIVSCSVVIVVGGGGVIIIATTDKRVSGISGCAS